MTSPDILSFAGDKTKTYPHIKQQELEALIGLERHVLCAPTAFLNLALEEGYAINPRDFAEKLDWDRNWNEDKLGWSRAGLSQMMRREYEVQTVSWWTTNTGISRTSQEIRRMCETGYLSDDQVELSFFRDVVAKQHEGVEGIFDLVEKGYPVTVTVNPGFAQNRALHAVILESYDSSSDSVTIFDPDERNSRTIYNRKEIQDGLTQNGACTIILPASETL